MKQSSKVRIVGKGGILKLQTIHYNKISNEMIKVQSPMLVLHVGVVYGWLLNYFLIAKAFTFIGIPLPQNQTPNSKVNLERGKNESKWWLFGYLNLV